VQKLPIPAINTVGLLAAPLAFGALYLGFVKLSQLLGDVAGFWELATAYAFSLVPIAFAYQVAHYYTLLLFNGQMIFLQVSDPFGWGWDLFGTSGYQINNAVVGAAFVWYSQVALIVAGHVLAVYLAHAIALRSTGDPKRALRSQYPMVALMVLYTILSLWILSQPIIEEKEAAAPVYPPDHPAVAFSRARRGISRAAHPAVAPRGGRRSSPPLAPPSGCPPRSTAGRWERSWSS
jgi:hypothetical protein